MLAFQVLRDDNPFLQFYLWNFYTIVDVLDKILIYKSHWHGKTETKTRKLLFLDLFLLLFWGFVCLGGNQSSSNCL